MFWTSLVGPEPGWTALRTMSFELIYPGIRSHLGCPQQDLFPKCTVVPSFSIGLDFWLVGEVCWVNIPIWPPISLSYIDYHQYGDQFLLATWIITNMATSLFYLHMRSTLWLLVSLRYKGYYQNGDQSLFAPWTNR